MNERMNERMNEIMNERNNECKKEGRITKLKISCLFFSAFVWATEA